MEAIHVHFIRFHLSFVKIPLFLSQYFAKKASVVLIHRSLRLLSQIQQSFLYMKFGKEFRTHLEDTLPEWRDKFLCYKPLKKLLKYYPYSSSADLGLGDSDQVDSRPVFADTTNTSSVSAAADAEDVVVVPGVRPTEDLQGSFVRILNEELEKFNDFYVDKEEDFVIRLQVFASSAHQIDLNLCLFLSIDFSFRIFRSKLGILLELRFM